MTQIEFDNRMGLIKAQEQRLGVKIKIEQLHDKDHLDCVWYGEEVGYIEYKNWLIVISAYGDIRLGGIIDGEEVDIKDKNNSGYVYEELGEKIDDDRLHSLLDAEDEDNYLVYKNNNWFEVDLVDPDGHFIDLCGEDNVLSDNLLECFENVQDYFEYVENELKKRVS